MQQGIENSKPESKGIESTGIEPLGVKPAPAAKLLGVSRGTVFLKIRTGELESVKIGRSRIITMRSIKRMLYGQAA